MPQAVLEEMPSEERVLALEELFADGSQRGGEFGCLDLENDFGGGEAGALERAEFVEELCGALHFKEGVIDRSNQAGLLTDSTG